MANATSNIPLMPSPPLPGATESLPTLTAKLSTTAPTLVAHLEEGATLGGVRDVQINGESVVERKVANIELGDGLEKNGNVISIVPDSFLEFVTISELSGQLTEIELQTLQHNKTNRILFGGAFYYVTQIISGQRIYFTTNPSSIYNEIRVNMETGVYQVFSTVPVQLAQHISDTVVHITDAERQLWNNKVSAAIAPDAETGEYNLKLIN